MGGASSNGQQYNWATESEKAGKEVKGRSQLLWATANMGEVSQFSRATVCMGEPDIMGNSMKGRSQVIWATELEGVINV